VLLEVALGLHTIELLRRRARGGSRTSPRARNDLHIRARARLDRDAAGLGQAAAELKLPKIDRDAAGLGQAAAELKLPGVHRAAGHAAAESKRCRHNHNPAGLAVVAGVGPLANVVVPEL
jgi:hypothetical protein